MKSVTLAELIEKLGCGVVGEAIGDPSAGSIAGSSSNARGDAPSERAFTGVAPLEHATAVQVSFLANDKYLSQAALSNAGAILCNQNAAKELTGKTASALLVCADPYVAFARVAQIFHEPRHPFAGLSSQAYVDASAVVHSSATIMPFAFVGPGAHIGANTVVYAGVFVGAASSIGADCILYPNCVVREGCHVGDRCVVNPGAVIGGDGFGFAPSGMENVRIPQVGGVRIENDVDIGSNTSIDRGAMADTRIGCQTKIDSLVQVAHNVVVGEACFLVAQVGIGGSTSLGKRVTLAGQVGVAGHVSIADFTTVLGQAGVTKSLTGGGVFNGTPARHNREFLTQMAALSRLASKRSQQRRTTEGK